MHQYTKTIVVGVIIIAGIFILLRFTGNIFISKVSPTTQTTKIDNSTKEVMLGGDAPYFDLASITGERVNLVDTKDQPTVIVFWATWNTESIDQIKILDDYTSSASASKSIVRIIPIDSQETESAASNIIRRGGYNLDVLFDPTGQVSNSYGVQSLPTTFFINKEGKISEIFVGTMSKVELVDKIEKIMN